MCLCETLPPARLEGLNGEAIENGIRHDAPVSCTPGDYVEPREVGHIRGRSRADQHGSQALGRWYNAERSTPRIGERAEGVEGRNAGKLRYVRRRRKPAAGKYTGRASSAARTRGGCVRGPKLYTRAPELPRSGVRLNTQPRTPCSALHLAWTGYHRGCRQAPSSAAPVQLSGGVLALISAAERVHRPGTHVPLPPVYPPCVPGSSRKPAWFRHSWHTSKRRRRGTKTATDLPLN